MTKLILTRDKHLINIENPNSDKGVRYNLKLMSMQKYNKRTKSWQCVKHQYDFFRGFSIYDIDCPEEKFFEMIKKTKTLNPNCESVSTFIARMKDALVYENYAREGIETECYARRGYNNCIYKEVLSKPLEFYNKNMIKFFKENKIKINMDFEKIFIENYDVCDKLISRLNNLKLDKEFIETIINNLFSRSGCFESFSVLVKEHNFDMMSLLKYVIEYLIPFENLDFYEAIGLLKDYYDMANTINRNVKKYPKYLKSMHDIITSNYRAFKKEYDEKLFRDLRKKELDFEGRKFCIVTPEKTKDVIEEGTNLNHCVSSYIKRILKRETYIFFLRLTENPENSLVTLELKGNAIVTAKGSYNRATEKEEREFLESYCKKKNLKLNIGGS